MIRSIATTVIAAGLLGEAAIAQQNTTVVQESTGSGASAPAASVGAGVPLKMIGGGARTNWSGNGNLLTQTQPGAPGQNTWIGSGKDHLAASPATLTAYGVGLADPNDDWDVGVFLQTSALAAHPVATASLPAGFALTGGGCLVDWRASPSPMGNLLTASFPSSLTTWECRSKDHSVSSPAPITAFVVGIRPKKAGIALPTVQITTTTSAVTNHPTAVAPALPGWVVTGGGARALPANTAGAGQLLTGTFPTTAQGSQIPTGWYAASKDHAVASPGTVQAFAVNLRFAATAESATAALGASSHSIAASSASLPAVPTTSAQPVTVDTGVAQAQNSSRRSGPEEMSAAAVSATSVQLSWVPASLVPVQVLRAVVPYGPFAVAGVAPAGSTGFTDSRLVPGTMFYYRLEPTQASATGMMVSENATSAGPTAPARGPWAAATTPLSAAPEQPTGKCAKVPATTPSRNLCSFEWPYVPGASGYKVYRPKGQPKCEFVLDTYVPEIPRHAYYFYGKSFGDCNPNLSVRAVFRMPDFPTPGAMLEVEGPISPTAFYIPPPFRHAPTLRSATWSEATRRSAHRA